MMSTYFNLFHFHCGSEEGHRFNNEISGFLNMELNLFSSLLHGRVGGGFLPAAVMSWVPPPSDEDVASAKSWVLAGSRTTS